MNPLAMALVFLSAPLHVGWNLLARRERSETALFGRMLFAVAAVGFLPAVISEASVRSIPASAWRYLLLSGSFGGAYFYLLARAYRSSDFTIVYPVARALPVLLVGVGDLARGREMPLAAWVGMTLVAVGCVCAPLHSFREVTLRRYYNRTAVWMALTALATVGYTLCDKIAVERETPGAATAFRHCYFFYLVNWAVFSMLVRLFPVKEPRPLRAGVRSALAGGFMTYAGYALIVWAYQLSRNASYILAFRQVSIIMGVILAFAIFRERGRFVRTAGAVLITAGLMLIAFRGRMP